ncbi:cobalamin biosynthesis protein [Streptomyces sp. NPDC020141]|uniref:cobalamin biosynthesis protein n=1 Tax=Streptomyces sp. NPDC020141 TaxID=3365065 RepID=UPI0037ADE3BB
MAEPGAAGQRPAARSGRAVRLPAPLIARLPADRSRYALVLEAPADGGADGPAAVVHVTDRIVPFGPGAAVLRPPSLVVGVGAARGVSVDEIVDLVTAALRDAGLSALSVGALATVGAKASEPGVVGAAERLGVPLVAHPAERLARIAAPNPSAVALAAVGTASVAEAAALASGGGELLVPKRVSSPRSGAARATCAVAGRSSPGGLTVFTPGSGAAGPLAPADGGGPRQPSRPGPDGPRPRAERLGDPYGELLGGRIGDLLGPGDWVLTPLGGTPPGTASAGHAVTVTVGGTSRTSRTSRMSRTAVPDAEYGERGQPAAEPGAHGKPGEYGDHGEYGVRYGVREHRAGEFGWRECGVGGFGPGSALEAALGDDRFSLGPGDLEQPWPTVVRRLRAAARTDAPVTLRGPAGPLMRALGALAGHRPPGTPAIVAGNTTRPNESSRLTTLAGVDPPPLDMMTVVTVGNPATRAIAGRMVIPRGYRWQP